MTEEEDARWPSYDEVVGILYELATGLFGSADNPYPAFEVMDRGLIESAIALPHQSFYESFSQRLAAMVRSIAANHGLRDGNKRLAVTVLHATLLVNNYIYVWNDEEAETLILRCATGDSDFHWLAEFIELWTSRVDDEQHPVQFSDPLALAINIQGLREWAERTVAKDQSRQVLHNVIGLHAGGQLPPVAIQHLREVLGEL